METADDFSNRKFKFSQFFVVWGTWTIGSFITSAISRVSAFGIIHVFSLNEDYWFVPLFLALFSLLAGGLQALILARRIPHSGWWLPVSNSGWLAILPVFWLLSRLVPSIATENTSPLLIFVLIGVITGFTQWLFLRAYWRYAIWWIPASIAGALTVAAVFGRAITNIYELSLIGLVPFAFSGLLVAWLFVDPLINRR